MVSFVSSWMGICARTLGGKARTEMVKLQFSIITVRSPFPIPNQVPRKFDVDEVIEESPELLEGFEINGSRWRDGAGVTRAFWKTVRVAVEIHTVRMRGRGGQEPNHSLRSWEIQAPQFIFVSWPCTHGFCYGVGSSKGSFMAPRFGPSSPEVPRNNSSKSSCT